MLFRACQSPCSPSKPPASTTCRPGPKCSAVDAEGDSGDTVGEGPCEKCVNAVDDDDGLQRDGCNGVYHLLAAGGRRACLRATGYVFAPSRARGSSNTRYAAAVEFINLASLHWGPHHLDYEGFEPLCMATFHSCAASYYSRPFQAAASRPGRGN